MNISELIDSITPDNKEKVMAQVREIQAQAKRSKVIERIDRFNRDNDTRRNEALTVWGFEEFSSSIVNSDGSLHETKRKKYPSLQGRIRVLVKDETVHKINGYRVTDWGTGQRFNTVEEYLSANSIQDTVTYEQYIAFDELLRSEEAKLDKAIEEYKQAVKGREAFGELTSQQNKHLYIYQL